MQFYFKQGMYSVNYTYEVLSRYISTFLAEMSYDKVTHQLLCSTYCSTYVLLLLISTQLVENSPKHCILHCVLAVVNQND